MGQPKRILHTLLARMAAAPPRLSPLEALILDMLGDGEKFGLQLVAESDGLLKKGTVYVTLGRMADKGLISSRPEPQRADAVGLPRRFYRSTRLGQTTLRAWTRVAESIAVEVPS